VAGLARQYRNVAPKRGHWLSVRPLLADRKRDAYGAEVTVVAKGRRRVSVLSPGQSYLCSHAAMLHFGLGEPDQVESLQVIWPDGRRENFPGCQADQVVVLRQGEGTAAK
jgi:hypothetical protein